MNKEELHINLNAIAEETSHTGPWQIRVQREPNAEWFVVVTIADTCEAIQQAWKLASLSSQTTMVQVKEPNGAYVAQVFVGFGSY